MSITVIARNFKLKHTTRDYIYEKFEKFGKFLRKNNPVRVTLSREKNSYKIILNAALNNHHGHLTITERAESLNEGLNIINDRAKVQLAKHKEKLF